MPTLVIELACAYYARKLVCFYCDICHVDITSHVTVLRTGGGLHDLSMHEVGGCSVRPVLCVKNTQRARTLRGHTSNMTFFQQ